MKIAIFHELNFGGARRTVNEFAKKLKQKNIVDLYLIDNEKNIGEKKYFNQIFLYIFNEKRWNKKNWKIRLYKDTMELFKLRALHKKIANDINLNTYDIVFIHPSRFTQAPFLLQFINQSIYFCQEPPRFIYDSEVSKIENIPFLKIPYELLNRMLRKYIDKLNVNKAEIILANSRYSQQMIKNAYHKKSLLCYLGVDDKLFKPIKVKKNYDILFIGEKNDRSGYSLLTECIKFLDLPVNIKTIFRNEKRISDQELVKVYNSTKIMVALGKNEPFGLIVLEAMACGVPVIAVNEGGFKESIKHEKTGYLISRDPKELGHTIKKLLTNDILRIQMGKKGRKDIEENWTWNKSSNRLLDIIINEKKVN